VIEHVCFDLDGTLVDSFRDIATALNEVLHALGRPARDPDEVKTMIGAGVGVLLERGLGEDNPELIHEAKTRFRGAYQAHLFDTTRPYDGVLELIQTLEAKNIATSIATNKPSWFTKPIVEELGLIHAGIRAVASADEAPARKPDPRVLELALQRTARPFDPKTTIYVGDMPIDLETARAFGCPLVAVAWGFDPSRLKRLDPEHWIEEPSALLATLARSFDHNF
jgi:phosphoglycolate phosphatase